MPEAADKGPSFVVVRLGGDSEGVIGRLRSVSNNGGGPVEAEIRCKQVPSNVKGGEYAFVWLGTNNNKGSPTPWVQGMRAFGRIDSVSGGPGYNDEKTVRMSLGTILPDSLEKKDFIRAAGDEYIHLADLPVLGTNNYSSQVVQQIRPEDGDQRVDVLLGTINRLSPGFQDSVTTEYPEIAALFPATAAAEKAYPSEGGEAPPTTIRERHGIEVPEGDPVFTELLARVRRLLKDHFGGVILRGPPGTSKSWYARRLAAALVDDDTCVHFVQFHPSYQYEDFVEGFVPDEDGTFRREEKHFLKICQAAREDPDRLYVLVIDELSRTDPARVFGEALTYLERTKRGEEFSLSSGRTAVVPPNVVIIATMNEWDRGVDEVDAAIERRFASVAMDPNREILRRLLADNGVEDDLADRIGRFFDHLQRDPNPMVRIGHAYFHSVRDESSLHRLWKNQLRFVFERAFPLNQDGFKRIERLWGKLFPEEPEANRAPSKDSGGGEERPTAAEAEARQPRGATEAAAAQPEAPTPAKRE